jgi:hypothetical protein
MKNGGHVMPHSNLHYWIMEFVEKCYFNLRRGKKRTAEMMVV